ncbi:hypothetical protein DYBT9275_01459 [Dyadobacter sp. CECT 9275]|uniref:Uncharacterized protein n=1 Tax=Dyadobacter helix TaxID=2822344 RepID=A0A916JA45_9BACT|nr:hypothetical protein [Dyadobacter sp. CECT 9275]CAG4994750.1 hypothetical protein DYBT9275_01459 [Dyadobacter sp. CECT 9275]
MKDMTDDENKSEWIDRYLDEVLPPGERKDFENSMALDPDFRLEVEAQLAVRNLIVHQGEQASLRSMFDKFHLSLMEEEGMKEEDKIPVLNSQENIPSEKKKEKVLRVNWGNWSYMAIAASIAITIIGVWTVLKKPSDMIGEQMGIRLNGKNEAFRVPFLTWSTLNDKPVLQDKKFIDVVIIRKPKYHFHYRFNAVIELYSDTLSEKGEKITLQYDRDTGIYKLWIGRKVYVIQKTDKITPLI